MSDLLPSMDMETIAALRQEYLRRGGPLKMTPETVRAVFVMPNPQPMVEKAETVNAPVSLGENNIPLVVNTSQYRITYRYGQPFVAPEPEAFGWMDD